MDAARGHAAASALQMTALVLPVAGVTATSGRIGVVGGAWRWFGGRRPAARRRLAARGRHRLWRRSRGGPTVGTGRSSRASGAPWRAAQAVGAIPTARPALTRERQRQRQLHGAPTVRDHGNDFRNPPATSGGSTTSAAPAGATHGPDPASTTPEAASTTPTPRQCQRRPPPRCPRRGPGRCARPRDDRAPPTQHHP